MVYFDLLYDMNSYLFFREKGKTHIEGYVDIFEIWMRWHRMKVEVSFAMLVHRWPVKKPSDKNVDDVATLLRRPSLRCFVDLRRRDIRRIELEHNQGRCISF